MKSHNILRELFQVREGFRQGGSQDEPWKLETRLDCIELAEEQRYKRGSLIYCTRAAHRPCRIGKTVSLKREIVTKENGCPMRKDEIKKRKNRMETQCCSIVVQQL